MAEEQFVQALVSLLDALDETTMDLQDTDYTQVPPDWRQSQPERYDRALQDLRAAHMSVLRTYKELVNTMNKKGVLPDETPDRSGAQQAGHDVRTGDNSPVNIYSPQAHSTGKGNASADVRVNEPPAVPTSPETDYPKSRWRDPKLLAILGVLALIVAVITLYFTVFHS